MTTSSIEQKAKDAKQAAYELASLSTETKNLALRKIAQKIDENKNIIFEKNKNDLDEARKMVEEGEITEATWSRLKLDENKMRDMVQGILDVAKLEDPVNKTISKMELDDGLVLHKVTTPIGLIGVIFEARPDVVPQIAALSVKSGNAVILKGGKEAQNTNTILANLINQALKEVQGFPKNTINLIETRDEVKEMLNLDEYIDLIIPRGGNALVKYIKENTKIPVLGHADGICHIFIDETADKEKALKISVDAKTQYPSACNSVETILLHEKFRHKNELINTLEENGVKIIENPDNFKTEYGEKILSLKTVKNLSEAINHINKYGSHHTDAIITENKENAEIFMQKIDSAGVFHNASTRFADGFRYGLGAEVGISTNKTHARGPVGLEGLTIYKYKLFGSGDIVKDYSEAKKHFTHKELK